ncbi:hypothetical protein L4D13_19020 [Photobacterium profundum]|uniref:hypothetical protein n=1 Tax=Photobacterium profundum TaxID=74109 RepID=UPI003D0D19CE
MALKQNTMTHEDGHIRIRINNQKDREGIHELFTAMGCYMHAIEDFNRLVINSVEPDANYKFKLSGVENGSLISKMTSVLKNIGGRFEKLVDSTAMNEVSALTKSVTEVNEPRDVTDLAKTLERKIAEELGLEGEIEPYIDPIKLAEILMLISNGNENLYEGETVEIGNYGNVIPINTKFRSKVPASKMTLTKKEPYRGYDNVKVIRPCNFGGSLWDLKSTVTKDSYSAHFHKECDWLSRYQNGEIPVVTAKHTLTIRVEYDKYITGKTHVVKNAIIKSVEVNEDPDGKQSEMFGELD